MATTPIRIVFFADTHLGFDYPLRPRVDRRRRGPDFFANFQTVLDYAVCSRADLLIHGGDLFTRSRPAAAIVDKAYEPLWRTAEAGIPILVVPGNHERSRLPSSLALSHANIYVFDRPRTYTVPVAGATVTVSGFPFARNVRETFHQRTTRTGWHHTASEVRLLCLHQTIEGAQVGPSGYTFRRGPDVIPRAALPRAFTCVLAGHIHRRQTLTAPGHGPVYYPGSTERTSFAERREEKGFLEVLLSPGPAQRPVPSVRFHPLPARPMEEVYLDGVPPGALEDYLRTTVARLSPDAIVRLRSRAPLPRPLRSFLTRSVFDRAFPATMNVHLGAELFRPGAPRR